MWRRAADQRAKAEMDGFKGILESYRAGLETGSQAVDWSKVSTNNISDVIVSFEDCKVCCLFGCLSVFNEYAYRTCRLPT